VFLYDVTSVYFEGQDNELILLKNPSAIF
jgi:hypothetical protein